MAESTSDDTIKVWPPIVWLCRWIWKRRAILFGIDILSAIWSSLPLLDLTSISHLAIVHALVTWVSTDRAFFLALFGLLISLTITCGLIVRLDAPLSLHQLQHYYLNNIIHETQMSRLKGIPAGLIAESVHLSDIFIPLQFRPNRPYVDYPLSNTELERYRQELKSGIFSQKLQRVVLQAEKNWYTTQTTDRIGIAELWKLLTSSDAVVIQGYPGTGKSTMMERLTLYMALRLSGCQDTDMPEQKSLTPLLLPILLRLGEYTKATNLTLYNYIMQMLTEMNLPGLTTFMQKKLARGSCLVILDGLDEVSDPAIRQKVHEAIKVCIRDHRGEQATSSSIVRQNRFLITSRVAGYDQAAFPDYPHVTIAELADEQIQDFLPRWSRANICRARRISVQEGIHDTGIKREVAQRTQALQAAFNENPAVKELAENPLLLTLLVVMQQNSIVLPQRRVELYDVVTRTLLENRNLAKEIEPIPPITALKRLGPLAFQMQAENNSFAQERDVMDAMVQIIRDEGGTDEAIRREATGFLKRIRERGGLFVQRSGDYFGFMHRTFQEYFAARYILNNIKVDEGHWINELVTRASRLDAVWREPFLLAVAYQSNENEVIANKILSAFLAQVPAEPLPQHVTHLLLAACAVIEVRPGTLDTTLEKQIAKQLLAAYEQAQYKQAFAQCKMIEPVMQRWLLNLPKEGYRLPLLEIITQTISDSQHIASQRAALTLLAMIANRLKACSSVVFETLLPPLLALSGLPAIESHHPTSNLMPAVDADVADLALIILSFLGKPGPAGLALPSVKQHFQDHPTYLRILARCSLEAGTLITPVIIPTTETNYQSYETAIARWIKLRDRTKQQAKEQAIDECVAIHQTIFDCAEEVIYPTYIHLLAMLQLTAAHPDLSWLRIWQSYLLEQLNTGPTISYQEVTFLWTMLFPISVHPLADTILKHFMSTGDQRQQHAQRLLTSLSLDLRDLRDLSYLIYSRDSRNLRDLRHLRHLRDLIFLRNLRDLKDIRSLENLQNLRDLRDIIYQRNLRDLRESRYLLNLGNLRELRNLTYFIYLRDFRNLILTQSVATQAFSLVSSPKGEQRSTALIILMGYLLQLQEIGKIDNIVLPLIQQVSNLELGTLHDNQTPIRNSILDLLRSLPARIAEEIVLVRQIAEGTLDQDTRKACANSLEYANPVDDLAWQELEKGLGSSAQEVREAAAEAMKQRKR